MIISKAHAHTTWLQMAIEETYRGVIVVNALEAADDLPLVLLE